ncbi:MAG: cbb3-type cytochrome c oxidase subunit I [Acidimicrobiales bacterium]
MARVRAGMNALSDHKTIGKAFMVAAVAFGVIGGGLAVLGPATGGTEGPTASLFGLHGVIMVFLFLLPAWLGLASGIAPLQAGARRMAFPRAHGLGLWTFIFGGLMVLAAPLAGPVGSDWTLAEAVAGSGGGRGVEMVMLGVGLVLVAAVITAVNLMVTLLQLRTPGMALRQLPLFSWSALVSSTLLVLALPVLLGALVMGVLGLHYSGAIFEGPGAALWPRLFWFGAYPMLWALVIPALGAMAEVLAVFAHRPVASHTRATAALGGIGVLAFAGWGGEVASLGARPLFVVGGLIVLAPVASMGLNLLLTLKPARGGPSPTLSAVGAQGVLAGLAVLAVGLGAAAIAAAATGTALRSGPWSLATQHLLFFGVSTLGLVAATHFWAPKLWGRHLTPGIGRVSVLAIFVGLFASFGPHLLAGLGGSEDLPAALEAVSTLGSYVLSLGTVLFAVDLGASAVAGLGRRAAADPWGGHTLEWATSSPPPAHNFDLDGLPAISSPTPLLELESASA